MAAPNRNAMTFESLRARIHSSQIIERLQKHILAAGKGSKGHMTESQVKAAIGLLKKTLPDLAAMTIEGVPNGEPVRFILEGLDGK